MNKKSLIGGISILGMAGMICKMVGVLYRIPLANIVGGEGLGLYQQVYYPYNLLLTLTSVGIPVAISRTVSHYMTLGQEANARKVFRVALILLSGLGVAATVLMLTLSSSIARWVGTPQGTLAYCCIAPGLLLVCVMSTFRGYAQGNRRMIPTAISQLIEQVGKVGLALPMAAAGMARGGWVMGAAGALLGTSIAEGVAMGFMMIDHALHGHTRICLPSDQAVLSGKELAFNLIRIAVPITLGACIVPMAGTIDSAMLKNLMIRSGVPESEAGIRYGLYSGMVLSMINVPTALAMAMSTNLVPDIASGMAKGDWKYVAKEAQTGLVLGALIGFPCSIGMNILAEPILFLCYGGSSYTPEQLYLASDLLRISSLTIILFTMVQVTSGILQGAGKQKIPMYTLLAGVACKIALNYFLVRDPRVGIKGAPFASLTCYTVSLIPNLIAACRYAHLKFDLVTILLRPFLAAGIMGAGVWAVWKYVFGGVPSQGGFVSRLIPVAVCIVLGIVLFAAAAVATGAVSRNAIGRFLRRKAS